MKTSFLASFFMCCLCSVLESGAQLTIYGGPQLTSAKYSIVGVKQETTSKQGFVAGVGLKTVIENSVFFAPQLSFSRKGYEVVLNKRATPPDSAAVANNTTLNTIELAPLIQVNFSKKASYGFVRFGPAIDFNLSGKETFDSANGKRTTRDMPFSFSDYGYATVSVNGQLGFQHKSGLLAFAYYSYGVANLSNADLGPTIFHRVAGLAVGWKLGRKR